MYMACVVVSTAWLTRAHCANICVYASKPLPSPAASSGCVKLESQAPSQIACRSACVSAPTLPPGAVISWRDYRLGRREHDVGGSRSNGLTDRRHDIANRRHDARLVGDEAVSEESLEHALELRGVERAIDGQAVDELDDSRLHLRAEGDGVDAAGEREREDDLLDERDARRDHDGDAPAPVVVERDGDGLRERQARDARRVADVEVHQAGGQAIE